jgi:hypothetical protein
MAKIKTIITKTVKKEFEIDVSFPIYRKHDLLLDRSDTVIYSKTIQNRNGFITYSVKEADSCDYEIETREHRDLCRQEGFDYCVGIGEYKSNEKEFLSVIDRMKAKIELIYAV